VRLIKILGLVAVSALAVMAIAASSAMAENTELCYNLAGDPCEVVKEIHFVSVEKNANGEHVLGKGSLLAGSNTVKCHLLVSGTLISLDLDNPVEYLSDLHYTDCNLGCNVKSTSGELTIHGVIDILRLGNEELADVTGRGFAVKVTCPFIFTCDYSSEALTGHGLPLNNEHGGLPHTTYTEAKVTLTSKLSGPFNCPSTGALDALLQSLSLFYIRA
jgi:hypothetical protein